MMLPLIRLKVGYNTIRFSSPSLIMRVQVETSEAKEMTNPVRFGQDFIGRVANPRDILQYHRKKKISERSESSITKKKVYLANAVFREQEPA